MIIAIIAYLAIAALILFFAAWFSLGVSGGSKLSEFPANFYFELIGISLFWPISFAVFIWSVKYSKK